MKATVYKFMRLFIFFLF